MKKLFIFLLLCSLLSHAQTTTVTATVTFPDANTFANGIVLATFTPPTGIIDQNLYLINGANFPYYVSGTFNGSGQFTLTLTDDHIARPLGGRWMFTVCSPATVQCTNSLQDVFGASIDLSSLISADVHNIFASANGDPIYFNDSEVKTNTYGGLRYFNYVTKTFRCWDGSVWGSCGTGGGGGGISVITAGNFDPVFTTNISNPTTTPLLTFIAENAPSHTVFANETGGSAIPSFQTDAFTLNTSSPLSGGSLVHLGGVITLSCPTCSVPQVSVTATSPIVVTPSPGVSTFVISCPTCGTNTGTVSSFSSGNLSPLFTTSVSNPTTTPALSFTLSSVAAHTVYANETGSSTLPSFQSDQVTINTASPLGGGGSLELGGTLSLTCAGCLTSVGTDKVSCQTGLGDGLNAMPAGTYLQSFCYNDTGVTVTLTGIKCYTNNNGTSTLNATNGAGTGLLTGAITCTNSWASGTQSGTTTMASGDYIKFTFVSDGASLQTSWDIPGTRAY